MTARVILYAAMSIDGCLADADGDIGWLAPFDAQDYGMAGFLAGIDALLTGRVTYDQMLGFAEWPYTGKRVVVLTQRPLDPDPPAGVEAAQGDLGAVVARLKAETEGDIWLLGGAVVAQAALARGLVDRLELFVIPVTLGAGIRLFGAAGQLQGWRLTGTRSFPNGVVELDYDRG